MKVAKPYINAIEHELRNYKLTRERIEELKDEIINMPPKAVGENERVMGEPLSDPTYGKAHKLLTNTVLTHMERTIKAIDMALLQLDDGHRLIFEHRYLKNKPWKQIFCDVPMCQKTCFNKRSELIDKVAEILGWLEM